MSSRVQISHCLDSPSQVKPELNIQTLKVGYQFLKNTKKSMLVFVNITEIDRPEYPLSTGGVWSDRCVGHVTSETVLNVSS